ncbi:hypothetical protein ACFXAQ_21630 [Streptomyces olivaceus]|uniref:hypothetical protein n=1 Tax=Streptomyces olivaceus TaxID=47716 RepID=UPI00367F2475
MRQIPVDTSAATVMVAKTPQPKVRDRRTGEIATDAEETGISGDLTMGTPAALTGLIARPWENEFNGQKRHGIAFRAVAVTSLATTGTGSKAA